MKSHRHLNPRAALVLGVVAVAAALAAAPANADAAGLYVTNLNDGSVSQYVVAADGTVSPLSPPTVAAGPGHSIGIAITPDGTSAYVSNVSGSISQYDVAPGGGLVPKSPPSVPIGSGVYGVAISPDGKSLYAADFQVNALSQFDIGPGRALSPKTPPTVPTGAHPDYVAVSPDGKSVYASNEGEETISQFDVGASGVLTPKSPATVPAGETPEGIAIAPNGKNLYVGDYGSNDVSQYDIGAGGGLVSKSPPKVTAAGGPVGVAVSPDGGSAYASADIGELISQFDVGAGGSLTPKSPATVFSAAGPDWIAVSPGGRSVYASVFGSGSSGGGVSQYDIGAGGVLAPKSTPFVSAGNGPIGVAIAPDQGPVASFSASAAAAGSQSAFNGSASSDPDGSIARYDWSFGDGKSALNAGPTPHHVYTAPGSYTVTLQVTDDEGCSAAELFTGQTAYCNADPGAITSLAVMVPRLPRPKITAARQTAARWREGNRLAQISRSGKRLPIGTTFSFRLNEQASVRFDFTRQASGRKVGHRCVAKTRKNQRNKACMRAVRAGVLRFGAHRGANRVVFQGRISRSKRLKPGRYTLVITATNTAGQQSNRQSLRFTIVK